VGACTPRVESLPRWRHLGSRQAGRRQARLGTKTGKKGRACSARRTHARAWVHGRARVRAKERADAHQHQDQGGRLNDGGDTASGRKDSESQRKGERVARAAESAATPARDCFPAWLEGRHHTAQRRSGDTTRHSRVSASLTQRPGAIAGREEDVLTYDLHDQKVKAAVKKRSVWRRGGRRRR
jgi:hypothetical protein